MNGEAKFGAVTESEIHTTVVEFEAGARMFTEVHLRGEEAHLGIRDIVGSSAETAGVAEHVLDFPFNYANSMYLNVVV